MKKRKPANRAAKLASAARRFIAVLEAAKDDAYALADAAEAFTEPETMAALRSRAEKAENDSLELRDQIGTHRHEIERAQGLIERNEYLEQAFKDGKEQMRLMADEIYQLKRDVLHPRRAVCPECGAAYHAEAWPADPPPSKSDPEYDAAIRAAQAEDERKKPK